MTAWAENDEMLASGYGEIDLINWNEDIVIIHSKHSAPPPTVSNFLISKHGESEETRQMCYLVDQYFINTEEALSLQLRYFKTLDI